MMDIVEKMKSQIGDDTHYIFDQEALFKSAVAEIERLRAALVPFATSLRIARGAFDGPADRGHLQAVAATYIRWNHLTQAEAVLSIESKEPKA